MTQPLDLAPIQARAEAATAGDWGWFDGGDYADVVADYQSTGSGSYSCRQQIARIEAEWHFDDPQHADCEDVDASEQAMADADFIAHARQDVPALIAEVTRLREINRRLDDSLKRALLAADEDPATCLCCGHLESAHDPDEERDCHASGARVMTCVCTSFIPCYPAPADDRYEGVCFAGTGAPAAQEG